MDAARILAIARDPHVPTFLFGSTALADWTREHKNPHTGEALQDSGFYVVVHRSMDSARRPDFRVLSRWHWGQRVPQSWDIPTLQTLRETLEEGHSACKDDDYEYDSDPGFLPSFREWLGTAKADPYHQYYREAVEYLALEEKEAAEHPAKCG